MADKAPAWVVPVMRAGYGARGLVYTIVGGLALSAAIYGGQAQGTKNALASVQGEVWGMALLWVISVGLFGYALWRWIDSAMDLEDYGHDAKGILARVGLLITGAIHAALGFSVARLALGAGSGGESGAQTATSRVMQMPYGPYLVGFMGLCIIAAGLHYAYKGIKGKYRKDIRTTKATQKLDPVMKAGFLAQGVVVAGIGLFIVFAAMTTDPSEAGGIGAVLSEVRSAAFGRILLGVVAVGLVAFAVENFIEAAYRIVPARAGTDVETLANHMASRAKQKTQDGIRAVTD